jgi:hypothetical protein
MPEASIPARSRSIVEPLDPVIGVERGGLDQFSWRVPKVPPKQNLSTPFPAILRGTLKQNEGGRS